MPTINGADYSLQSRTIPQDASLVRMAEHFDPFLLDWQLRHPSVFRDRIPMGMFPLYSGYSQRSFVFRGTLGPQAGLSDWAQVEPSRKAGANDNGFDRCSYTPQTYNWAYDAIDFSGLVTSWRSPIFCVNDLKYLDKAQQQLGMIIKAGAEITDQAKETFNRESYMKQAADNKKFAVMAEGNGVDFIDNANFRVTYNPFVKDADGDTYITMSAVAYANISSLNFTSMDLIRQYLGDQCPDAAVANEGGMPVYGAMLDLLDFEKFVLTDQYLREDFRRAIPSRLIEGFNMGFRTYRGWMLIHDARQARFAVKSTSATTITAKRILPRRAVRPGVVGLVPECNPDYITAELGTLVVFLNNVIQILVPAPVDSLGVGMTFGPAPDFNGQWAWLNILDPDTNPLGENGYFFSRYEYYVKALQYAQNAIVLLYRRCPQVIRTGCLNEQLITAKTGDVALTVTPVAADFSAANHTVVLTLADQLAAKLGDTVTITNDSSVTFVAYIAGDKAAPTYTFAWLTGATNAPTAVTEINDITITKVTVS